MNYIKKYSKFLEDADGGGSTAGSGDVSNAIVGDLPGVGGEEGSGDVSSYIKDKKQKKGDPSEVSDARFLDDVDDEITKVDDLA